jgi:hypothetical protein
MLAVICPLIQYSVYCIYGVRYVATICHNLLTITAVSLRIQACGMLCAGACGKTDRSDMMYMSLYEAGSRVLLRCPGAGNTLVPILLFGASVSMVAGASCVLDQLSSTTICTRVTLSEIFTSQNLTLRWWRICDEVASVIHHDYG